MATAEPSGLNSATRGTDFGAVDEDGFESLRDAVAANFFRAVASHHADDQAADDGNKDGEPVHMILRRGDVAPTKALVVEEVGAGVDEVQEDPGEGGAGCAEHEGQAAEHEHARAGAEVAQEHAALGFGGFHRALAFLRAGLVCALARRTRLTARNSSGPDCSSSRV